VSTSVGACLPGATGGVPGLATYLVEGLGGPPHDMKRIRALLRGRATFSDHGRDPVRAVGTDVGQLGAALGTQNIEERTQRGPVPPRCGPHQPATVVVDDHSQVLVSALVGDLVDPDPTQALEPVEPGVQVGPHPGHDRAHGAPGDPHQFGDRGLRALGRQPRHLLIEDPGMAGSVSGPGHDRDCRPVLGAVHPWRVRLEHDPDRAQIQTPPPATPLTGVIPRSTAPAPAAPVTTALPGPDMGYQQLPCLIELDVLHNRLLDAQKGAP